MKRIFYFLALIILFFLAGCCSKKNLCRKGLKCVTCSEPAPTEPIIASCPIDTTEYYLDVPLYGQQRSKLCWAATSRMLQGYYGVDKELCVIVEDFLSMDCCPDLTPCNGTQNMPSVMRKSGFSYNTAMNPLSWEEIKMEIYCNKNPMVYEYYIGPNEVHATLIVGFDEDESGNKWVWLNDPSQMQLGNNRSISYDSYYSGSRNSPSLPRRPFYRSFINLKL